MDSIDPWIKVAGALVALAVTLIVPLTGFFKEWWNFRVQMQAGASTKTDVARSIPTSALADAAGAGLIAEKLTDIARAIREGNKEEAERESTRIADALEALQEKFEGR